MDLSQAETWVVAYLAHEDNMKYALQHSDIHSQTACVISDIPVTPENVLAMKKNKPQRYLGKQGNHANSYGQTPPQFVRTVNKQSDKPPYITVNLRQSEQYHRAWHSYYKIKGWWSKVQEQLNDRTKYGPRVLITPYDRVRMFFERWGPELFKAAYAHLPQSTVADHAYGKIQKCNPVPGGILEICKFNNSHGFKTVHTAHDSVMCEIPLNLVSELAPQYYNMFHRPLVVEEKMFYIPVDCDIGTRWGPEMEEYKIAA